MEFPIKQMKYSFLANWSLRIFLRKFDEFGNEISRSKDLYPIHLIFHLLSQVENWDDVFYYQFPEKISKLDTLKSIAFKFHLEFENPDLLMKHIYQLISNPFDNRMVHTINLSTHFKFLSSDYTVDSLLCTFDNTDDWDQYMNFFISTSERTTCLEALLTIADYLEQDIPDHWTASEIINVLLTHVKPSTYRKKDAVIIQTKYSHDQFLNHGEVPRNCWQLLKVSEVLRRIDKVDSWNDRILPEEKITAIEALQYIAKIYNISLKPEDLNTPNHLWKEVLSYFSRYFLAKDEEIHVQQFKGDKNILIYHRPYERLFKVGEILDLIDQADSWDSIVDEDEGIDVMDCILTLMGYLGLPLSEIHFRDDMEFPEFAFEAIEKCVFESFDNVQHKFWPMPHQYWK